MSEVLVKKLDPETIVLDPNLQPRNQLIADAISQYTEDMKNGDVFPPVDVVNVNGKHILTSGWHRVLAARKAQVLIAANVKTGTMEDAKWDACGSNVEHDKSGNRRTNADKQKAIKMALRAWVELDKGPINASEIARHVGVSWSMAQSWADKLGIERPRHDEKKFGIPVNAVIPNFTNNEIWDNSAPSEEDIRKEAEDKILREWEIKREEARIRREKEQEEFNRIQQEIATESKSVFNEVNENIEWAAWSWNPVTGCRHDCDYCYARDIANRFYPEGFEPSYHPERLSAPANTNVPITPRWDGDTGHRNVFTCSMADLFGKWVPTEWIESVLESVRNNPQWTFLFLTKFPIRMAEFDFPPNTWIGTTVDRQWAVDRAEKAFRKIRDNGYEGVAWLSCEPMLEDLNFSALDMFDWVVVGGSSKSTQTPEFKPPFPWIANLWNQAKAHDLPVYMKTNLGIEQRVREYPTRIDTVLNQ